MPRNVLRGPGLGGMAAMDGGLTLTASFLQAANDHILD